MNIYLVERIGGCDYDEYDSFVIICESEKVAKNTDPDPDYGLTTVSSEWTTPENLEAELIGTSESTERRIVCSSFNAS